MMDYLGWYNSQAQQQQQAIIDQQNIAMFQQSDLSALMQQSVYNQRNVYAIIEEQRIEKAKADYPGWFEPASEWDKIA